MSDTEYEVNLSYGDFPTAKQVIGNGFSFIANVPERGRGYFRITSEYFEQTRRLDGCWLDAVIAKAIQDDRKARGLK